MHVRRFHALWLAAVYLAVAGAGSAAGQPASVELDATVGLDGWVSGDGPMRALATIEATVLFVGELHVDYGGVTSRLPVEVPTDSGQATDEDLRSLLRRRLRFLCLLLALLYGVAVILVFIRFSPAEWGFGPWPLIAGFPILSVRPRSPP